MSFKGKQLLNIINIISANKLVISQSVFMWQLTLEGISIHPCFQDEYGGDEEAFRNIPDKVSINKKLRQENTPFL